MIFKYTNMSVKCMESKDFYYKKDRLNQLRGFCAVVEAGSVNKARDKMGVEPTAISKQIIALERDLKLKLFDRGTKKKGLTLTENGKEFYNKAVGVLRGVEGLFDHFYNEIENKQEKEIRIALHHTVLYRIVPNYIKKFKEKNKDVLFILKVLSIKDSLKELANNDVDIVLHTAESEEAGFSYKLLYDLDPMILVNKNNKLALKRDKEISYEDLSKQNLMMMERNKILPEFSEFCKKHNIHSDLEFENISWESIRNFVKLDLGVHLYSDLYNIFPDLRDSDVVSKNVSHIFPAIKMYLITKSGKVQNKKTEEFTEMVEREF